MNHIFYSPRLHIDVDDFLANIKDIAKGNSEILKFLDHIEKENSGKLVEILEKGINYLWSFVEGKNKNKEISPEDLSLWIRIYNNLPMTSQKDEALRIDLRKVIDVHTKIKAPELKERISLMKGVYVNSIYNILNKCDRTVNSKFCLKIDKKEGIYILYYDNKEVFRYNEWERNKIVVRNLEALFQIDNRIVYI